MFKFIKNIIHYDYLYRNRLKKNLSKYDFSLIEFLKLININIDHLNFFDKSFKLSVNKYISGTIDPFLIFRKKSITRNHDRIAIQLLIKSMQTKECVDNIEFRKTLVYLFQRINDFYSNEEYEQICLMYIKSTWMDCFTFYRVFDPDFNICFSPYTKYNNWNSWNNCYNNYYNNYYHFHTKFENSRDLLKSHFDKLGIEMTKDISIIKSQYRKLCFIHHPDKGGDMNMFISITESYNYILQHIND